jgi:hypothetical protein
MARSNRERFFSKVEQSGDCLIWTKSTDRNGHGVFWVDGRLVGAHRAAWFFEYGEWPTTNLLHSCDVYACVDVRHLRPGSQADNMADMVSKGRQSKGEARPNSRLTADDVRTIRAEHESGARTADLARTFRVHRATVRDVVTGRRWKSVA